MTKFIDELMRQLYTSSISLMDILVIAGLSGLSSMFHWSVWILLLPWVVYSTHQKIEYDK
jgi:hypothetical protein